MPSKNFTSILVFFLVVIIAFFAVQVVNILTRKPLPTSTQQQLQQVDPNLNQSVIDKLKSK